MILQKYLVVRAFVLICVSRLHQKVYYNDCLYLWRVLLK